MKGATRGLRNGRACRNTSIQFPCACPSVISSISGKSFCYPLPLFSPQFHYMRFFNIPFSLFQVSSWGGYVFLINLIPLHVITLMVTGRFSHRIYVAYSTLYCVGTILSMQISFVGFQPVQSSEHMLVSYFIYTYFFITEMLKY